MVLDAQLALTRESTLPEVTKVTIARMDGSETICVGGSLGESYRMYHRPGLAVIEEFRRRENLLLEQAKPRAETLSLWRAAIKERMGWASPERHVWLLGQDAAFAASLAARFKTVGGVIEGMRQAVEEHVRTARVLKPLGEDAPLVDRSFDIPRDVPAEKWGDWYEDEIRRIGPGVTELVLHPGLADAELQAATRDRPTWGADWRQRDYDFFSSERFRNLLKETGLRLVTWREIDALYSIHTAGDPR